MSNRKQSEYQLIAYEVLKAMNTSLVAENVALAAAQAIKTHTDWQTVAILVPDSHNSLYVCASIGSLPIANHLIHQTQLSCANQHSSSLIFEDYDIRRYCALTARIQHQDDSLGILYVSNLESDMLKKADRLLAVAIADALALGLNNVQLMRHLQQQAVQLEPA